MLSEVICAWYRAYRSWQILRAVAIWRSLNVMCTQSYASSHLGHVLTTPNPFWTLQRKRTRWL